MADVNNQGNLEPEAPFAKRVNLKKDVLTQDELIFIRRVEAQQWGTKVGKLRTKNALTGLLFGALVIGIYGYTFHRVSQDKILAEMDAEVQSGKFYQMKTGAN
ncbi:hypothetical protein DNTS_017680 [Danionella cerebrum]|uniref:Cytochrome c oxidase assembly factor 3 n=1 Tax=Danionella cerebrum TaxID=2873325 RepID=A0A553RKS1_9TELE|nr:hypothetical protein DNTS_017680 [Danionella translucida]